MDRDTLPGALITTAACALAVGVWATLDPDREPVRPLPLGAAALSGITVALLLALPQEPQPVWLAVAAALAGLTVGMVTWVLRPDLTLALVGACAVWIPWAVTRMNAGAETLDSDLVAGQLSLLALLVGLMAFGQPGGIRRQGGSPPGSAPRPHCSPRRCGPTRSRPTPWGSPRS